MDTHDSLVTHEKTKLAIHGHAVCFYFGTKKKSPTLNSVNIAVNRGIIYSLLGPSGCGKTTLMKCIVGQHKPQAGSLKIYGRSPGSKRFFIPGRGVGYMPQDLELYLDMTTEEILTYFGFLYGMDMKVIKERISFLVDLLELPDKKKLIQNLSGAHQRGVSFAIALIHHPPLLVLDEPTVGVEPLLRRTIWDHLLSLARNEHLTIILTTHCTEEARQAHTVGLMRNGHMLVERSPEDLIKQSGGLTLEDVFLKLCHNKHNEDKDLKTNIDELIPATNLDPKRLAANGTFSNEGVTEESYMNSMNFVKTSNGAFDDRHNVDDNTFALLPLPPLPAELDDINISAANCVRRLFCLTRKNFLRFRRNIIFVLFILIVPALQVIFTFLSMETEPFHLQVAIANEDEGANRWGEMFLHSISDSTIKQKKFRTLALAYESLSKGESWAALHISSEFSICLADRVAEGIDASNDTLRCSTVKVMLDVSNYIIAGTIRNSLWESHQKFAKQMFISLGHSPLLGEVPMQIEEYKRHSKPASFAEFVAPAFILCISHLVSIALTEMSIIRERKYGLLGRALVAGATTTELVLSFFFQLLVVVFIQILIMLAVAFFMFSLPCNESVVWVILACTLAGICGMSCGFLISSVTDDENSAAILAFGYFFPVTLLSGSIWPVEAMSYPLRYFSYCLPLTRLVGCMRSVMAQGSIIADNYIWDGYLICSSWILVHMTLSVIFLRVRK